MTNINAVGSSSQIKDFDEEFEAVPAQKNGHIASGRESAPVLILDDDAVFREDLTEFLVNSGIHAREVVDPRLLTHAMLEGAILLLDLTMPEVDGIDVLRDLSSYPEPPSVILVSGCNEDIIEAAARGARLANVRVLGTLKKPFDPVALVAMLEVGDVSSASCFPTPLRPPSPADLVVALEEALETGDVPVAFQPKAHVHTMMFCGAEILIGDHWPKIGRVNAATMIAEARQVPQLLTRLTFHMVQVAAKAGATWSARGYNGAVSVNVPLETLQFSANISKLAGMVRAAGIEPAAMILELTEDALYDSTSASLMALVQARLFGFGIALDDVVQEQSGLLQLANLPITELKIDRELLVKARESEKSRNIYKFLVGLGHRLDLHVVAEGVETEEDYAFVKGEKVDIIQGYLLSRKVPFQNLMEMLDLHSGKFAI